MFVIKFKILLFWNYWLLKKKKKTIFCLLTFPKQQILDSSKLKELQTTISKIDEIGRKSLTQVENTVRKGEIAHYEQFLLFPLCFQKTCTADT